MFDSSFGEEFVQAHCKYQVTDLYDQSGQPINIRPIQSGSDTLTIRWSHDGGLRVGNLKVISFSVFNNTYTIVLVKDDGDGYTKRTCYFFSSPEDFYRVQEFLKEKKTSEG